MTCFDCAMHGVVSNAVAICVGCGAGVCLEHAHVNPRWLTTSAVVNRIIAVEPPARVVRCAVCTHAQDAAARPAAQAKRPRVTA